MILKKDFGIRGYYAGKNIQGHENDYEYVVFCKKNGRVVGSGFPTKSAADRWLSKNIRTAKELQRRAEA